MTVLAPLAITGRCYCGQMTLAAQTPPTMVTYCHCSDCRRVSGAPVAAFAAFEEGDLHISPDPGPPVSHSPGVMRWFCKQCGSPLAAQYAYLPGQIYVPLGLIDQSAELPPTLHSHTGSQLPWLHIDDDLERKSGSGRTVLQAGAAQK